MPGPVPCVQPLVLVQDDAVRPVCLSRFDGRVVAKLPFTPLSYILGLSHRNLLGDDTTDCSFIFLYILCTMSIRQVSDLGGPEPITWSVLCWRCSGLCAQASVMGCGHQIGCQD